MNQESAKKLNTIWKYSLRMRVYAPRQDMIEALDWLIEDYKRLDRIVQDTFQEYELEDNDPNADYKAFDEMWEETNHS